MGHGKQRLEFTNDLAKLENVGDILHVSNEYGYTRLQVSKAVYAYGIRRGKKFSVSQTQNGFVIVLASFR